MNCKNCGVSMFDKMLHRTNPTGQPDAGWMCIDCIDEKEPELGQNIKSDDYQVLADIEKSVLKSQATDGQ